MSDSILRNLKDKIRFEDGVKESAFSMAYIRDKGSEVCPVGPAVSHVKERAGMESF